LISYTYNLQVYRKKADIQSIECDTMKFIVVLISLKKWDGILIRKEL